MLHATSASVQVLTLAASAPLTGDFDFTHLGERRWQARTTFVCDGTEIAAVEEGGRFTSGAGARSTSLHAALMEAALDGATDEAVSNFIRLTL
ncbi:hypothetical protein [Deinococcus hopiensis]|uniref:Uncharacterized protein n=1 Tax=Deinococcus hopiensis KR-140 TaxID=695939 RepID=A0A1W1VVN9_9DEIO|nr:hypothetical protein [Deinococcus hopiensis]SMB97429.1 hypothetical protein SAMN00790413_05946 [Deinococcus hopiensis KR-140]